MTRYAFFGLAVFLGAVAGLFSCGLLTGVIVAIVASVCVFPWSRHRSLLWLAAFLVVSTAISFGIPRFLIGTPAVIALVITAVSTILFFLTLRVGRRWAVR